MRKNTGAAAAGGLVRRDRSPRVACRCVSHPAQEAASAEGLVVAAAAVRKINKDEHSNGLHRKAAQDAKRGNLFQKLVRAIIIAAKEGGGDPGMNMRLKTAIERAKAVSVPQDNITRAIKRGTGELGDVTYEELLYEAYGPSGIAVLVSVLTDNRNRTTPEIRANKTQECFAKEGEV